MDSKLTGEKINYRYFPLQAFLCTMCLATAIAAIAGLAPFGDRTLIISDAYYQYTSFWSYYKDMLIGKQDPFYALEMTIGGNVRGLLGYYSLSLFNALLLLFPTEKIALGVHLILLLKLSFSSCFLALFFEKTGSKNRASLIFTSSYAFCGYVLAYSWCSNWLDGFMLLPLIALGIYYICNEKAPWLYLFSLACSIIINYYIAYMLCIFSVLYFIYQMAENNKKPKFNTILSFGLSSLAAGGISAMWLFTALLSMKHSKRTSFEFLFYLYKIEKMELLGFTEGDVNYKAALIGVLAVFLSIILIWLIIHILCVKKKLQHRYEVAFVSIMAFAILAYASHFEIEGSFLHKLLIGYCSYDEMWAGLPNIYSGISSFVFAVYFFLCKDIKFNRKRNAALFLLVMFLSMHLEIPNMLWHGLTTNSGFNTRYSFIVSFFIICIANESFGNIKAYRLRDGIITAAVAAVIISFAYATGSQLESFGRYAMIFAEIVIVSTFALALGVAKDTSKLQHTAAALLTVVSGFSIIIQSCVSVGRLTEKSSYEELNHEIAAKKAISDTIKENDKELYRVNFSRNKCRGNFVTELNDPMLLNYNGISHFSSNESTKVIQKMERLGLTVYENIWASGIYGTTEAFDDFFGVRYHLNPALIPETSYISCRNPNALQLAFVCSPEILKAEIESANAFENQNTLFSAAYPELNKNIFTEEKNVKKEYNNLKNVGKNRFIAENPDLNAELIYKIKITQPDPLYLFCDNYQYSGGEIYINGEFFTKCSDYNFWNITKIGSFKPGTELEISVRLNEDYYSLNSAGRFCYENKETLREYTEKLKRPVCEISSNTDSEFKINVNQPYKKACLLLTIPYDEGWQIKIDGKKSETKEAYGFLLAAELDEGEHCIELKYIPEGLISGGIISFLSLSAVISAIILSKKIRGKKNA